MNKDEMRRWLLLDEGKTFVQVHTPNEIFPDLNQIDFKSWKHKAFTYCYYYLCDFIYRNTLYGEVHAEQYSQSNIVNHLISHKNTVSYITKENGLLEKLGYVKSTKNYPISFYNEDGIFEFYYINQFKETMKEFSDKVNSRFSVREPIKSLNRFDEDFSGTYYQKQNTHLVTINRFVDIVTNDSLGYVGLFMYAYLSMMNDMFRDGYIISNKDFSEVVGCSDETITKYTKKLEELGYVKSERKLIQNRFLMEKKYTVIDSDDERRKG